MQSRCHSVAGRHGVPADPAPWDTPLLLVQEIPGGVGGNLHQDALRLRVERRLGAGDSQGHLPTLVLGMFSASILDVGRLLSILRRPSAHFPSLSPLEATMRRLGLLLALAGSCATAGECVILLHGMARTSRSMEVLEKRLTETGYTVRNVEYPSREHRLDTLARMAVGGGLLQLSGQECAKVHFVTHSLGGILVRAYLASDSIPNLGRVVMLGPPNKGSEVADRLKDWSLYQMINGPVGQQLGTDPDSPPNTLDSARFEVGVIAGDLSINWINSQMLPGRDDGKVTVEATRLKGMKDHIVIHSTHPMMMRNKAVLHQTLHFLAHGVFDRSVGP